MPPALIYRSATQQVEEVSLKGLPLGSPVTFPYRKTCVTLSPGDTVMLMSDGFPELFSEAGEMLGTTGRWRCSQRQRIGHRRRSSRISRRQARRGPTATPRATT